MMLLTTFGTPRASPATEQEALAHMTLKMLAGGLIAGFAAGLIAAMLHFAFVQNLILLGEQYETGALTHFEGEKDAPTAEHAAGHEHAHKPSTEAGENAFSRNALTVTFTCLIYAAYGLILVAGFGLAERFGISITMREGILWGIAGFAAFQLAPALGLAPELPGTIAADLGDRQIWWVGTVAATATGLALLAFAPGMGFAALAVILLAAPHLIGAPVPDGYAGSAPPELAAAFTARVLGVGLAVWAVLGGIAGKLWSARPA